MQMLITVFACLTWPDSAVCHKATRLATTFLKEVRLLKYVGIENVDVLCLSLTLYSYTAITVEKKSKGN